MPKKLKSINTKYLKSIINENFNRGKNGHDYFNLVNEFKNEFYERENKKIENILKYTQNVKIKKQKELTDLEYYDSLMTAMDL